MTRGHVRKSPLSLPVLLPQVWVRPMVVIGKWLIGHVFICRHYIQVMSLYNAPQWCANWYRGFCLPYVKRLDFFHLDANAVSISINWLLSKSAQTLPGCLWQQLLIIIYAFGIFLSASKTFRPLPARISWFVTYVYSLLFCHLPCLSILFLKMFCSFVQDET